MAMVTEGNRQIGQQKKTGWDCVNEDMKSFGLSRDNAQDKDDCRLRINGVSQIYVENRL